MVLFKVHQNRRIRGGFICQWIMVNRGFGVTIGYVESATYTENRYVIGIGLFLKDLQKYQVWWRL